MTVFLGESLFSDDFYCPLYPGIYRALLWAWQEYGTRRAGAGEWGMLHILAVMLQTVLWVHPPTRSLCDIQIPEPQCGT